MEALRRAEPEGSPGVLSHWVAAEEVEEAVEADLHNRSHAYEMNEGYFSLPRFFLSSATLTVGSLHATHGEPHKQRVERSHEGDVKIE